MNMQGFKLNIVRVNCPHCHKEILVRGCHDCDYVERNYFNYPEAKECWECDMFHKNHTKGGLILK